MAELTLSELPDVAQQAIWWLTYRKTNDWRGYPVDGWVVDVPEVRPASIDAILPLRALVLDGDAPIDRRIDAALTMAKDADGGQLLIQLAAENRLASPLREAAGSVIFSNPDRSVRAAAAGLFPRPGGPQRMTVGDVIARAGDAARGQVRFAAACSTCHRVGTAGADVGPELTDIHKKFDRAGLVDADRRTRMRRSPSATARSSSSRAATNRTSVSSRPMGRRFPFATATAESSLSLARTSRRASR